MQRLAAYVAGTVLAALLLGPILFPPAGHGPPDLLTPLVFLSIPFLLLSAGRVAGWLVAGFAALVGFGYELGRRRGKQQQAVDAFGATEVDNPAIETSVSRPGP